ncbi:MAG: caspase family protein [Bacteroidota bacterium]|uniref:caspase family protein n=1 Tax=Mucilaginibacter lappiensis TaxID=354630 RepID=UPI003361AD36
MKRQILIITGHPHNETQKAQLQIVGKYYNEYFKSNTGGAYEDAEITNLETPKVNEIQDLLKEDKKIDFAVLVLIGHGATQEGKQLFQINADEIINPGQIELTLKKQLVVVESCRVTAISDHPVVDVTDKIASFKDGGKIKFPISKAKSKELYNAGVEKCNDGLVVCFACDEDEKASKLHFTKALIEMSKNWSANPQLDSAVASIQGIMVPVAEHVKKESNDKQSPQIWGTEKFPFAISRY